MRNAPQRIVVIGLAGSGKSTLAAQLAQMRGGEHIELDRLHWEADWRPAPTDVFRARVRDAVAADCWVACGNYSVVRDLVWPRADHIVWLDYGLLRIQVRVLRRTVRRLWTREEVCNGNRESIATFFSRDSLLLYNRAALQRHRAIYPGLLAAQAHANVVHHRTPRETAAWLSGIGVARSDNAAFKELQPL